MTFFAMRVISYMGSILLNTVSAVTTLRIRAWNSSMRHPTRRRIVSWRWHSWLVHRRYSTMRRIHARRWLTIRNTWWRSISWRHSRRWLTIRNTWWRSISRGVHSWRGLSIWSTTSLYYYIRLTIRRRILAWRATGRWITLH